MKRRQAYLELSALGKCGLKQRGSVQLLKLPEAPAQWHGACPGEHRQVAVHHGQDSTDSSLVKESSVLDAQVGSLQPDSILPAKTSCEIPECWGEAKPSNSAAKPSKSAAKPSNSAVNTPIAKANLVNAKVALCEMDTEPRGSAPEAPCGSPGRA